MFIDKNSLKINGLNMGSFLIEVKYSFNKLFSEGSGRTLSGKMNATLIGIFPKINCKFRRLNKQELETLTPILDSAVQNVTYYDPYKKQNITIQTYTGDYEILNKNIGVNEEFNVSFISIKKR